MAVPGHEIAGKAVAGEIVWIPGPGMLNVIVCAAQFASTKLIASRSDPAPLSLVLTTTSGSVTATDGEYSELRTQPSPQVSTVVAADTLFQLPAMVRVKEMTPVVSRLALNESMNCSPSVCDLETLL